ncbi:LUD domain-containing protein [Labilibaculum filiforme]|nr:LUD domain-containing protein [Labilibaculum filiforme]
MEVKTDTQRANVIFKRDNKDLLESFLSSSNDLGHESLTVDYKLFIEAANRKNVQFEFIRLKSFRLNKSSFDISNAKNAIIEADYALADSGTLIIDTRDQDVLLTVYLAEVLHVVVPASKILYSMDDFEFIKGKRALNLGGGIASVSISTSDKENRCDSKVMRTIVYVIEDL